ncbi:MAG: hypothetical protein NC401_17530 [Ruminococcus sp.]|nr:hypothetical protein [Ruminococcus sp.]
MTRTINKKIVAILLAILFSFCWIATTASAVEVDLDERISSNEAPSAAVITPLPRLWALQLDVTPCYYADGDYWENSDEYTRTQSGKSGDLFNCEMSTDVYWRMKEIGCEYLYITLTFQTEGVDFTKIRLMVDGDVEYEASRFMQPGYYSVTWLVPMKITQTTYSLTVSNQRQSLCVQGHIGFN